jgi:hypothetical protein
MAAPCLLTAWRGQLRDELLDLVDHLFRHLFDSCIAAVVGNETLSATAQGLPGGNTDARADQHRGHCPNPITSPRHDAVSNTGSHPIHQIPHGQHLPPRSLPKGEDA